MSVSIRLIQHGKKVEENTFGGRSIREVLSYFKENEIEYQTSMEYEELKEMSQNEDAMYIFIDDANVVGYESMVNFFKEYYLEYDETVYKSLMRILLN